MPSQSRHRPSPGRRTQTRARRKPQKKGRGILNSLIDALPFELHLPGSYRYCGPGTRLAERLKRGDPGINSLDEACKSHDIAYSKTKDTAERNKADLVLADKAWERVKASDSSLGERVAAYAVTNAMKLKAKMGAGCNKRRRRPGRPRKGAGIKRKVGKTKRATRRPNKKRTMMMMAPRIIPLPPTGGNLRSILSRIGMATKSIPGAIKKIRSARGKKSVKIGRGLYLRPYHSGYGLYLRPYTNQYLN